ncbi:hypothetical protein [Streptomyces sp. NPDC090021]|uniref:hypothetical protein n=1 Tax=Streptomyces sp. NPDC090021 TaxID=3365919 RepID=UPI0037FEDD43
MRLRTALASSTAALALVLSAASPSSAAIGEFQYTTVDLNNIQVRQRLIDPVDEECINLDSTANLPALLGRNFTNKQATVFRDADCEGDVWWVVNPGGARTPVPARFRSVVFN